jgi:hypothetical protein
MKNWKYDLFNFKQGLTLDQLEISSVVEKHIYNFDKLSEKELVESLKYHLASYSYDNDVHKLFESMEEEIAERPLLYDLKDLYKKVEKRNYGMLYREPLSKILDIISKDSDQARMEAIINDLQLFDWVNEIKAFIVNLTTNPMDRKNLTSNGAKGSKVYTIVESVDGGHVAFIGDRWFMLTEKEIKQCVLSDVIKDKDTLNTLKILEKAMSFADYENGTINFKIDENLSLAIGLNNKKLYINGEVADKETTLEDIFNSPIIPYMKKNLYETIKTVSENLDKNIELDVANKVTSLSKPLTEIFAFNYKDKMYLYSIDKRTGSSFFEYDSVNKLIEDVQREMGYELSHFFENKLSKELRQYKRLEDKEIEIELKIKEVNESLDELKQDEKLMNESAELKTAFDNLLIYKHNLIKNLNDIKNEKVQERKKI